MRAHQYDTDVYSVVPLALLAGPVRPDYYTCTFKACAVLKQRREFNAIFLFILEPVYCGLPALFRITNTPSVCLIVHLATSTDATSGISVHGDGSALILFVGCFAMLYQLYSYALGL
jgi:hypothetical protein